MSLTSDENAELEEMFLGASKHLLETIKKLPTARKKELISGEKGIKLLLTMKKDPDLSSEDDKIICKIIKEYLIRMYPDIYSVCKEKVAHPKLSTYSISNFEKIYECTVCKVYTDISRCSKCSGDLINPTDDIKGMLKKNGSAMADLIKKKTEILRKLTRYNKDKNTNNIGPYDLVQHVFHEISPRTSVHSKSLEEENPDHRSKTDQSQGHKKKKKNTHLQESVKRPNVPSILTNIVESMPSTSLSQGSVIGSCINELKALQHLTKRDDIPIPASRSKANIHPDITEKYPKAIYQPSLETYGGTDSEDNYAGTRIEELEPASSLLDKEEYRFESSHIDKRQDLVQTGAIPKKVAILPNKEKLSTLKTYKKNKFSEKSLADQKKFLALKDSKIKDGTWEDRNEGREIDYNLPAGLVDLTYDENYDATQDATDPSYVKLTKEVMVPPKGSDIKDINQFKSTVAYYISQGFSVIPNSDVKYNNEYVVSPEGELALLGEKKKILDVCTKTQSQVNTIQNLLTHQINILHADSGHSLAITRSSLESMLEKYTSILTTLMRQSKPDSKLDNVTSELKLGKFR